MSIRILVPVKRVIDANIRVRVSSSGVVEATGLKMSLNPFDECALEKALQLKEAGIASRVTVLTCGRPVSQDVLRTALAMGADDAVLIDTGESTETLDSPAVARLLNAYMTTEGRTDFGLVLCGKQGIDNDTGAVAGMLAALLDWPQALNASALSVHGTNWHVSCGDDRGTSTWELQGPCVVSADLRLAEPRRVTLPSIVKAKTKPLGILDSASLGVALKPRTFLTELRDPPGRKPGVRVEHTAALLDTIAKHISMEKMGAGT